MIAQSYAILRIHDDSYIIFEKEVLLSYAGMSSLSFSSPPYSSAYANANAIHLLCGVSALIFFLSFLLTPYYAVNSTPFTSPFFSSILNSALCMRKAVNLFISPLTTIPLISSIIA